MTELMISPEASVAPDVRLRILRNFAGGANATMVAHQVGVTRDVVQAVLDTVGNDRDRARATARLERNSTGQNTPGRPSPSKPAARVPVLLDRPVEDVLADADQAGGSFGAAADRIRTAVVDLTERLAEHRKVAEAEQRVRDLQQQLADATNALHTLRPAATARLKRASGVDSKAVRAWAKETGVDCPAQGRVPQRVLEQWRAATGGVA